MKKYYTLNTKGNDIIAKDWELAIKERDSLEHAIQGVSLISAILSAVIAFFPQKETPSDIQLYYQCADLIFVTLVALFFSNITRKIVYAERKIVILRSSLNLTFHDLGPVLPRNRIEGAVYHSDIQMFSGFFEEKNFLFTSTIILNAIFLFLINSTSSNEYSLFYNIIIIAGAIFIPLLLYRIRLLDDHENIFLLLIRLLARVMSFNFVKNIEHTYYQAQLNVIQTKNDLQKVNVSFKEIISRGRNIATLIEDNTFDSNYGINVKGFFRAIFLRIPKLGKRIAKKRNFSKHSGGSSVTQQMVRTLFFTPNHTIYKCKLRKTLFRFKKKFFELLLARFWASKVFSKNEIMELYLCSIRYAPNISKLTDAIKYYNLPSNLNKCNWFFLIERLAWINPVFNWNRIKVLANKCDLTKFLYTEIIQMYANNIEKFNEHDKLEIQNILKTCNT